MPTIATELRQRIIAAAQNRCEYCQTAQEISGAQMHIEHIQPLVLGGQSVFDNLCLACAWCNSYKGVSVTATDPETGEECRLFHPRQQRWADHFEWREDGIFVEGKTAVGRATVGALKINNPYILPARRHWVEAGWHPPK
ncbi:MAG: HNH endonuclease [Chloroflexota bacterium]